MRRSWGHSSGRLARICQLREEALKALDTGPGARLLGSASAFPAPSSPPGILSAQRWNACQSAASSKEPSLPPGSSRSLCLSPSWTSSTFFLGPWKVVPEPAPRPHQPGSLPGSSTSASRWPRAQQGVVPPTVQGEGHRGRASGSWREVVALPGAAWTGAPSRSRTAQRAPETLAGCPRCSLRLRLAGSFPGALWWGVKDTPCL